jgi:hypothetical protein
MRSSKPTKEPDMNRAFWILGAVAVFVLLLEAAEIIDIFN